MTISHKIMILVLFIANTFSVVANTCDASIKDEYLKEQALGKQAMLKAFLLEGDNTDALTSALAQLAIAEHYLRVLGCLKPTSNKFYTSRFDVQNASDLPQAGFIVFSSTLNDDLNIDLLKITELFDSTFYVVEKEKSNVR